MATNIQGTNPARDTAKGIIPNQTVPTICQDKILKFSSSEYNSFYPKNTIVLLQNYVCIPIQPYGKRPLIKWKNITQTPNLENYPNCNIAIMTGEINDLLVVDIDIAKESELSGFDLLTEYEREYGIIKTPKVFTQSGGMHLYFKYDKDLSSNKVRVNNYSIDIRSDGGYIIAPPSKGEHGNYMWINNIQKPIDIPPQLKEILLNETIIDTNTNTTNKTKTEQNEINVIESSDISEIYTDHINHNTSQSNTNLLKGDNLINILQNLPQTYCDNYYQWLVISTCLKSGNLYEIWDNWSKSSSYYNKEKNDEIWNNLDSSDFNLNYISYLANKEGIKIVKYIDEISKYKPNKNINSRYISVTNFTQCRNKNKTCFVIKSPCGTGKTTFANKWLNRVNCEKFLSICCRVSLGCEQHRSFNKRSGRNVNLYSDITDYSVDNLIIQLDSITKLSINEWKDCALYIDEMSFLLNYLVDSSTLNTKRIAVHKRLCSLIKNAKYILCTDANMNDMCLELLKQLNVPFYFLQNNIKIDRGKAVRHENIESIIEKMQQDISNNKKFFGVFDTRKQMEIVIETLTNYSKTNKHKFKFKAYSSETGDKKDLLNVNKTWKNRYVFYTPSVTIGVSYDVKDNRNVYLFSESCTVNANTLVQMSARCRNINTLHYFSKVRYSNNKFETINDVKRYYNGIVNDNEEFYDKSKNVIECNQTYYDVKKGKEIMREDIFNVLFYWNMFYESNMRSAYREYFEHRLKISGFTINHSKSNKDSKNENTKLIIKKSIKDAKKTIKSRKDQSINNALLNDIETLDISEKRMRNDMMTKANIIGINFENMDHRVKFKEFIINDRGFEKFRSYQYLKMDIKKIELLAADFIANNGMIKSLLSNVVRAEILAKINNKLGVKSFHIKDIDNKVDVKKKRMIKLINRVNRSYRIKINDVNGVVDMKDILIKMYIMLFDKDIIKVTNSGNKIINPQYIKRFKINKS